MNLYLDDDSVDALLVRLLQHAGHDVQIPADVAISGRRDLKPAGIVRAIRNLEQAAVPLRDEYHILNHWR